MGSWLDAAKKVADGDWRNVGVLGVRYEFWNV
jgi:hypothetical protein